jgi:FtsZ-binding cell division protein ZapB
MSSRRKSEIEDLQEEKNDLAAGWIAADKTIATLQKRIQQLEAEVALQKDFVLEGQDRLEASLVEKGNAFDKIRSLQAEVTTLRTTNDLLTSI